ncbi:hypothetical protein V8E55_008495 [Tylopilus felleus]
MEVACLGLQKSKKKKEFLRDEKQQAIAVEMVVPPPPIIVQALQKRLLSEPIQLPLGSSNTTSGNNAPAPLLTHINEQPTPTPPTVQEGTSSRGQGQIILNRSKPTLPHGVPLRDAPVEDWRKFIEQCQNTCPVGNCRGLHKMFPGAIGCNVHPDNEDLELNAPTPQQLNYDRMVWVQGLVHLLMVPGRGPVAWLGQFTNQASMTDIVAYLTVNGVTVCDANDMVWWACSAAQEMLIHIEESGGFDNPAMSAHYAPIRKDLMVHCTTESLNCTREWCKHEAQTHDILAEELPTNVMSMEARMEDDVFQ